MLRAEGQCGWHWDHHSIRIVWCHQRSYQRRSSALKSVSNSSFFNVLIWGHKIIIVHDTIMIHAWYWYSNQHPAQHPHHLTPDIVCILILLVVLLLPVTETSCIFSSQVPSVSSHSHPSQQHCRIVGIWRHTIIRTPSSLNGSVGLTGWVQNKLLLPLLLLLLLATGGGNRTRE